MKTEIIKNETDPKSGYTGIHMKCGAREAYITISARGYFSVACKTYGRFGMGKYFGTPADAMNAFRLHEMKLMIAAAAKERGIDCPVPMPPPPKAKFPKTKPILFNGMMFNRLGIRTNGKYYPASYHISTNREGTKMLCINAKDHCGRLPAAINPKNDTDSMTDYFDRDRAKILEGNPGYAELLPLIEAIDAHYKAKYA